VEFVNPSFEIGKPELIVDVDRVRAAELGLTVSDVGTVVESLVNGIKVGPYDDGGREIDLILRGPEEISSPKALEQTMLHTPSGQTVQLADLARIRSELGPTQIEHTDMDRSIKLSVGVEVDEPLGAVMQRIEGVVGPVRAALPLGYSVELGGQADDLTRTWRAFRGSLLLAILITYLLLASLFESFRLPLVILVTMPFAASGGIIALKILNSFDPTVKLDVITMLGFVILVGLVVNNAILLVHQALNRMSEGAPMQEAVLNAVSTRVRPIFMTMTTTVFGMSPLVFAQGAGSELYRGLAAILVGGLILSTLFTLILVPTLLTYVLRERDPVAERAGEVGAASG
jgi:HAE1 family hydrophobic/amphiphilic exporter-1